MAKSAVISMTKTAALENIGDNIRINAVCPTAVETEMLKTFFESRSDPEAAKNEIAYCNPMHSTMGMLQPEDITGVVSFLIGENSKFITGQYITVDGGYSIQ